MELDKIKQQTTWNDASGSININFEKIRQAIVSLLGGGGGAKIEIDSEMSDTSENAVQNKTIKKYVDDADNALSERINALEQNGGGGSSEGSLKTYVFYLDEELTEEKIEANKSFYEAAISESPASYVVSSYGAIAIPTMVAGSQDSVIIGITTNDEIADSEARDREYLDVRNLQIELVEDGTFTIHKQFESRLAKVSMLDEVIAKVDEIPDLMANLPQGEKFYYVHLPFEDAPLDEEQLAENAASCTKWLEAHKNNEPLPILCWSAFPYGDGRMYVYDSSDGLLNFSIRMTLGVGNDESLDNAELVGMLIVDGLLYSTGEVELYKPLEEKGLTTINSFKTINGQSILGEGDIEIQGGGNVEVDAELSETSENAVSNKAVTMALAETEEVTAAALNELNKRFEEYATKEDIDATLAEMDEEINHIEGVLEATIIEDEEVTAAALNDLDKRVNESATKEELAESIAEVESAMATNKKALEADIIDNEEVTAAALVALKEYVDSAIFTALNTEV